MPLYSRYISQRVTEALADTPVVLLSGPRQAGKTTLVRQFSAPDRRFITLDDESTLLAARQDPVGLVRDLDRAVIDEVQRAPQLLLAIKKSVDEDRRPGRFLLTGSADLMTLPTVADSLAGRMETLVLLPLAGCEMQSADGYWIDAVFNGAMPKTSSPETGPALVQRVLRGGYPEAVARTAPRRRTAWLRQYTDALIQRDVRQLASVEKLDHMPRLLRSLAQTAGQMCNFARLAGQVGLDSKTANKYFAVLEQMFLLRRLEPFYTNRLNRIVKTPKAQFVDTGLLSMLLGLNESAAGSDRALFGRVLECYVYGELLKQTTWAGADYALYTYRDKDQVEVDIIVEDAAGRIVGIETKAAATVSPSDLKGLKKLAGLVGDRFVAGVVLYDGDETLPIGAQTWAMPLATLWQAGI